ncbi:trypsin-like serine peptidase [Bradyrhizobium sp. HKCCYLR20261]|uniref:trypsin-like serine peptidase n=1 Tax=Bradyrhizobium sp. HKCCYLR20261 TaxID=3420760 RepID=UPI003EBE0A64
MKTAIAFVTSGYIACFGVATAVAQEFNPLVSAKLGGLRIQLDTLGKSIIKLNDQSLQVIYQDLDDKLKSTCKVIYCGDDRRNYFEGAAIEQKAADSTLLFVRQGKLIKDAQTETWSLPANSAGLCTPAQIAEANKARLPQDQYEAERFYDEPAPGFCTGFKVGKDLVATAGHCVRDALDCQSIRTISGFRIDASSTAPHKSISAERIFACKEIIGRSSEGGSDWAIIRVDRDLSALPQVELRQTGQPAEGAKMTVVGYPLGLPVKIAGNANVRSVSARVFKTNSDTYGGNSGSPVFDTEKLVSGQLFVEGILVKGETDFIQQSPCRISKRCESKQCNGEDATLAIEFRNLTGQ